MEHQIAKGTSVTYQRNALDERGGGGGGGEGGRGAYIQGLLKPNIFLLAGNGPGSLWGGELYPGDLQ